MSVLTCQQVVELVTDFLERALPAGRLIAVTEHLAGCPECTLYVDQIRTTVAALGQLTPGGPGGPGGPGIPDCDDLVRTFRGL